MALNVKNFKNFHFFDNYNMEQGRVKNFNSAEIIFPFIPVDATLKKSGYIFDLQGFLNEKKLFDEENLAL